MGSSKKDLLRLPPQVIDTFGYAFYLAQVGSRHPDAKPLRGFGSAGVLEVVAPFKGDAYRAVYTTRIAKAVVVLHVFQKKSHAGSMTPQHDMKLIRGRLASASGFLENNGG